MESISYGSRKSFNMDLPSSYYSVNFNKLESFEPNISFDELPIPKLEDSNIHYRCPKCFNFPLIEFINKNEEIIIYSCACYKGKRIFIQDLFDKEKKYMSFQNNPNKDSKIEEVVGYMCTEHKSYTSNSFIYNNFEYYCLTKKCNKNLCKKCIEEHLQAGHDILIFDYQNFETKKKVNEIIEFENKNKKVVDIKFESENNINLSGFDELIEDENESKIIDNEIKEFKVEQVSKNTIKILPKKNLDKIHNNFIELINIILTDYTLYPNYIHFFNIQNIYRILINHSDKKEKLPQEKVNPYIQLIFYYGQYQTRYSFELSEKIRDILRTLLSKINPRGKRVKCFYNGFELNEELKIEEIITEDDKKKNKMEIKVVEICELDEIKIKEIKCPKCDENTFLNFSNYKINLKNCKNGHCMNKILINDFMKTQNTDTSASKIIYCSLCSRRSSYQSSFFICFSCNKNLCVSCKEKHNKIHRIINYTDKNFICSEHSGIYQKYCITCKKNICISCEKDHIEHKSENFKDIIQDKEALSIELDKLKKNLQKFKDEINLISYKINHIKESFEIYYKIFNELTKTFSEMNHKNYQIIQNINEFIKYNDKINKDIMKIINNSSISEKMKDLFSIYDEISSNNYINGEILIDNNNINKEVRIINSYEQRKREGELKNKKDCYNYENEQSLRENCLIFIDDIPIEFSYFYKFSKPGLYKIKYLFKKSLPKTNDMFSNCSLIKKLDFSNFISDYIFNMCSMFYGCKSLEELNLSSFNTENVINMGYMFFGCESLKIINFSDFNTKNVVDMGSFISGCKSLITVDFSKFDIQNVKDLSWMFFGCNSLTYINLFNFNTENVIYMNSMLYGLKFDNENLNIYTEDKRILNQIIKYPTIRKKIFFILSNFYVEYISKRDLNLENLIIEYIYNYLGK